MCDRIERHTNKSDHRKQRRRHFQGNYGSATIEYRFFQASASVYSIGKFQHKEAKSNFKRGRRCIYHFLNPESIDYSAYELLEKRQLRRGNLNKANNQMD